jgi:transposase InsO family protein
LIDDSREACASRGAPTIAKEKHVAFSHDEERVRAERARAVGLFRYSLVREAADPKLSTKQRGRLVRALAEREHDGPSGQPVRVSRASIDRWIRAWRHGGFDALVPPPRQASPRTPTEILELAVALKKEVPERTAAQIAVILRAHSGWSPDERTLQRNFHRLELITRPNGAAPRVFGRFEAEAPNTRWTGDALHGPTVNGRKAILFAFIDDHSRMFTGYRWARREDTVRLEAALRTGLASRGVPASIYVDNGSAFVDKQLLRACASLGIRLVHSRPGQPAGRGKIERAFRTVRDQFLVEIGSGRELGDMVHLNTLFTAWVETVYHQREHSETGQSPWQRWSSTDAPALPTPAQLREAFLWSEWRTVTKTGSIGLHGNKYEVDAALVGRKVELVFDPFDLTRIDVRWHGRSMGQAVPHVIGRHVHHKARVDEPAPAAPAPTGIDYLRLVEQQHTAELAARVQYSRLRDDPVAEGHVRGRLPLPDTTVDADGEPEGTSA